MGDRECREEKRDRCLYAIDVPTCLFVLPIRMRLSLGHDCHCSYSSMIDLHSKMQRLPRVIGDVKIRNTDVGRGVFAVRPYPIDSIIGEIMGNVIDDPVHCSEYCMDLEDGRHLEPDAPFRFVNHCCEPNCEFEWFDLTANVQTQRERRVFLISLRDIQADEQLTIDYNWPASAAIPCHCQAESCRGWIVDLAELDDVDMQKDWWPKTV